ncbi:MAG: hypothetical protein ACOC1P_00510, partial [Minisyncoccales bacterium]
MVDKKRGVLLGIFFLLSILVGVLSLSFVSAGECVDGLMYDCSGLDMIECQMHGEMGCVWDGQCVQDDCSQYQSDTCTGLIYCEWDASGDDGGDDGGDTGPPCNLAVCQEDGTQEECYADADNDGFADLGDKRCYDSGCSCPSGYKSENQLLTFVDGTLMPDCDDNNANVGSCCEEINNVGLSCDDGSDSILRSSCNADEYSITTCTYQSDGSTGQFCCEEEQLSCDSINTKSECEGTDGCSVQYEGVLDCEDYEIEGPSGHTCSDTAPTGCIERCGSTGQTEECSCYADNNYFYETFGYFGACEDWSSDLQHPQVCEFNYCYGTQECTPNCGGKECGGDDCGGSCGSCDGNEFCEAGICVAVCDDTCSSLGYECGTQTV